MMIVNKIPRMKGSFWINFTRKGYKTETTTEMSVVFKPHRYNVWERFKASDALFQHCEDHDLCVILENPINILRFLRRLAWIVPK